MRDYTDSFGKSREEVWQEEEENRERKNSGNDKTNKELLSMMLEATSSLIKEVRAMREELNSLTKEVKRRR